MSVNDALMSTRLLLIAHAETEAQRQGRFGGDEGLNQRGLTATVDARERVPMSDAAFTSAARAARETASSLGLDGRPEPALSDLDLGAWRGRSLQDLAEQRPDAAAAWRADPDFADHGGESIETLVRRVGSWLESGKQRRGLTIAVTHVAVCRAAVVAVLTAPRLAFWSVDIAPLGLVALGSDGRRWALRELRGL